ncbi:hypothetical protein XPA_007874 [Xanthoria parietina]
MKIQRCTRANHRVQRTTLMLGMTQNNGHAWSDDVRIKKEADKKETAKPRGDGASSRERKLSGGRGRVEVAAEEGVWRRPRKGQCGGGGGRGRGEGRVEEEGGVWRRKTEKKK